MPQPFVLTGNSSKLTWTMQHELKTNPKIFLVSFITKICFLNLFGCIIDSHIINQAFLTKAFTTVRLIARLASSLFLWIKLKSSLARPSCYVSKHMEWRLEIVLLLSDSGDAMGNEWTFLTFFVVLCCSHGYKTGVGTRPTTKILSRK